MPLAMAAARVMVGQTLAGLRQEGLLPEDAGGRVRVLDRCERQGGGAALRPIPGGSSTRSAPRCARPARLWAWTAPSASRSPKSQMAAGTRCRTRHGAPVRWPTGTSRPGSRCRAAFTALGFSIAATLGTARATCGPRGRRLRRWWPRWGRGGGLRRGGPDRAGEGAAVVKPRARGHASIGQDIRRASVTYKVPCLTTLAAARAVSAGHGRLGSHPLEVRSLQDLHRVPKGVTRSAAPRPAGHCDTGTSVGASLSRTRS